jgi:hypothetical protein
MEKITTSQLEEMIKNKFLEKGVSKDDITNEILKNISERIKTEVKNSLPTNVNSGGGEIVNVDISKQEVPKDMPGEKPESITTSVESNEEFQEMYKKEGELEAKERALLEKEEELRRKEEELRSKEEELQYKPEVPEKLENLGCEKLFVFNENDLSVGAEKLSNTYMNLVEDPENKTSMKDLWLKDGKRDAEVFIVNFEKIGRIEFDPFEGISNFINEKENSELEGPTSTDDYESSENNSNGNMIDSIAPVKDVIRPMSNDMGLDVQNSTGEYQNLETGASVQNVDEESFEELLNSKLKEIIKNYLSGQIVLGQKK